MTNWVKATVVENICWHERLFSLRVKAPLDCFIAGQFTKLALEVGGERFTRAYSFVNSPDNSIHEFYYVTVEGGALSPQLALLSAGDSIDVAVQASGFFTLVEVPDGKELWLLSTGTAIGPYLSMLETPDLLQRFESIVLVHCVRHQQDLSYQAAIKSLENDYGNKLTYLPIVTRDAPQGMLSQRVPLAISNGELARRVQVALNPASSQVMICGNPAMVRDAKGALIELGFIKNLRRAPGNITVENYW